MELKLCLSCLLGFAVLLAHGQKKGTPMETTTKPLVCKLTTPESQRRKATVIAELKSLILAKHELDSGYRYEFEAKDQPLDKLNEFIKTERVCCDFFTFQLKIESDRLTFDITGPKGTKEFLKEEVDL
jgi:hypothetical protein